jgi:hypothetical protein
MEGDYQQQTKLGHLLSLSGLEEKKEGGMIWKKRKI